MQQINPFADALNSLIAEKKTAISIAHFKGPEGYAATWQDMAWRYTNKKGQSINYWFVMDVTNKTSITKLTEAKKFPSPLCDILMMYAIAVHGQSISFSNKVSKHAGARQLLTKIEQLVDISNDFLKKNYDGKSNNYITKINNFIAWMQSNNLITKNIYPIKTKQDTNSGADVDFARQKKVPKEKVLVALGAIHYDVIPPDEKSWNTHPVAMQRDAFVCAMVALAMGSPNRAAAEQTIIDNQELKEHSETVEGKERTVFYLDWKGSKGYQNNQNHILSHMSEAVRRSIKYMRQATEPSRVLARFFTDPHLPLKQVLFDHRVDEALWQKVNPDISKPINLFTLAYLLGLYNNDNAAAQVIKGTADAFKKNPNVRNSEWLKPIALLLPSDVLKVTTFSIGPLLCAHSNSQARALAALFGSGHYSVADMQQKWITHVKTCFPAFPRLANNTKEGECDARTRLFAISGHQISSAGAGGVGMVGGNLPLMPVGPAALASIFLNDLKMSVGKSIFTRHGFSEDFTINPHQFRHYINHTADENNVPKIIINMWSGRTDPTQIATYTHTTGADRSSKISDILLKESTVTVDEAKKSIRLYSKAEYDKLTNSVATETSSGICTQALIINPCNFLSEFETQCVFCESSVHVAHDEDAIALLEKDLRIQTQRLQEAAEHPKFMFSEATQSWYKVHFKNTEMLRQLIELMTSKDIEQGALIRLLTSKAKFHITNLQTKIVDKRPMALPNPDQKLEQLLEHKKQSVARDTTLDELLGMI